MSKPVNYSGLLTDLLNIYDITQEGEFWESSFFF